MTCVTRRPRACSTAISAPVSARPISCTPLLPSSRRPGHLLETKEQLGFVSQRLDAHGANSSTTLDIASKVGATGVGLTVHAAPDTPGKLAAFAFAFEHLEIASYEMLKRVAERAGDQDTMQIADRIMGEERSAANKIAASFDLIVEGSLDERGVGG